LLIHPTQVITKNVIEEAFPRLEYRLQFFF